MLTLLNNIYLNINYFNYFKYLTIHNLITMYLFISCIFTVPPERPVIYKPTRHEKTSNVESFNEGTDIVLICEVSGGKFYYIQILMKLKIIRNECKTLVVLDILLF